MYTKPENTGSNGTSDLKMDPLPGSRMRGLVLGGFLLLFCENLRLLIIALKPHLASLLGASGFTSLELSLRGIIAFLPLLLILALWWASRPTQTEPSFEV